MEKRKGEKWDGGGGKGKEEIKEELKKAEGGEEIKKR